MRAPSILIVEDDFAVRRALASTLLTEGYDVTCAANGREAFEIVNSGRAPPEVIILDICMPEMNGVEFRRLQRSACPCPDIPVVVVTASRIPERELEGLGVRSVLRKPFGLNDILQTIERAIT